MALTALMAMAWRILHVPVVMQGQQLTWRLVALGHTPKALIWMQQKMAQANGKTSQGKS
jgi:hypothetical protein